MKNENRLHIEIIGRGAVERQIPFLEEGTHPTLKEVAREMHAAMQEIIRMDYISTRAEAEEAASRMRQAVLQAIAKGRDVDQELTFVGHAYREKAFVRAVLEESGAG